MLFRSILILPLWDGQSRLGGWRNDHLLAQAISFPCQLSQIFSIKLSIISHFVMWYAQSNQIVIIQQSIWIVSELVNVMHLNGFMIEDALIFTNSTEPMRPVSDLKALSVPFVFLSQCMSLSISSLNWSLASDVCGMNLATD